MEAALHMSTAHIHVKHVMAKRANHCNPKCHLELLMIGSADHERKVQDFETKTGHRAV